MNSILYVNVDTDISIKNSRITYFKSIINQKSLSIKFKYYNKILNSHLKMLHARNNLHVNIINKS